MFYVWLSFNILHLVNPVYLDRSMDALLFTSGYFNTTLTVKIKIEFSIHLVCVFAYDGVQHMRCCRFLHPVYTVLPVSLDCSFLISPSVFSNVYLQNIRHVSRCKI